MKTKKYNFIPEHQLGGADEGSGFSVSITSSMCIFFAKFTVDMYGLDKKFVRIYADIANRTIAWREVKGSNLESFKDIRQLGKNSKTGAMTISVAKILKKMGLTRDMLPLKNIPVTEYADSLMEGKLKVIDLKNLIQSHDADHHPKK